MAQSLCVPLQYFRFSVGGMTDVAEIKGHRWANLDYTTVHVTGVHVHYCVCVAICTGARNPPAVSHSYCGWLLLGICNVRTLYRAM